MTIGASRISAEAGELAADAIDALLHPKSIALIGVSDNAAKISGRLLKLLIDHGFRGEIYPVNPNRDVVQGMAAFRSIADLAGGIDLAVIALPAEAVLDALEQLGRKGVRAAIVMSAGFGETGDRGRGQEERLAAAARAHGMALLGPNCQGVFCYASRMAATFATCFVERALRPGPLALISQSGAVAQMAYNLLDDYASGLGTWVSTGNEAGLDVWTIARHLVAAADANALLVYVEGLKSRAALEAAGEAALEAGKPVIALQPGRSDTAAHAALTHTGSLVSGRALMDALFERYGIIRAESLAEFAALGVMAGFAKPAPGLRFAVLSNSGGLGVMCMDDGEAAGLAPAVLSDQTRNALRAALPAFAAVTNPVDVTGQLVQDPALLPNALAALIEDADVDIVVAAIGMAGVGYDFELIIESLVNAQQNSEKLIAALWVGGEKGISRRLNAAGVPCFEDPALGLRAISLVSRYHLQRAELLARLKALAPTEIGGASPLLAGRTGTLDEAESKAVLARYGVPVVDEATATTAEQAIAEAKRFGYPVAVKILSSEIAHKSEAGGVILGLANDEEARSAFARLTAKHPGARVLVQPMVPAAVELSLGLTSDPAVGRAIVLGAGGRLVELLDDTQILLPPIARNDVMRALGKLRIASLLAGYRGAPAIDRTPLIEAVLAFARLVEVEGDHLTEVDVNPLIVMADGAVMAVDALIVAKAATPDG